MISYADNHEDVVLWRALGSAGRGFYLDVGAGSPDLGSVTRHFYEFGWHGINVEPLPDRARELRAARSRDVTYEVAAGNHGGQQILYRVRGDEQLSTLSPHVARRYRLAGASIDELRIDVRTLDDLLEEVQPERLDFLRISVDGDEQSVLDGIDLWRWRARVLLIHVVGPDGARTVGDVAQSLRDARYCFASTDGVNDYFVREEETDLCPRLVPANSNDRFTSVHEQNLEDEISRLKIHVRELERTVRTRSTLHTETRVEPNQIHSEDGEPPERIDLDRLAILTTPVTGSELVARTMCDALGLVESRALHPADVRWGELPDRAVVELCWPRSEHLYRLLSAHGFVCVTVGRHPFETVLAFLQRAASDHSTHRFLGGREGDDAPLWDCGPTSSKFLKWATGDRASALLDVSASWWADPATVRIRYSDLSADPHRAVLTALSEVGIDVPGGMLLFGDLAAIDEPDVVDGLPGGWERYLDADTATRLLEALGKAITALGFSEPHLDGLPSRPAAEARWAAR